MTSANDFQKTWINKIRKIKKILKKKNFYRIFRTNLRLGVDRDRNTSVSQVEVQGILHIRSKGSYYSLRYIVNKCVAVV